MSPLERRVVEILKLGKPVSAPDIAAVTGLTAKSIRTALNKMMEQGEAHIVGHDKLAAIWMYGSGENVARPYAPPRPRKNHKAKVESYYVPIWPEQRIWSI